jgi:hypothetical protein
VLQELLSFVAFDGATFGIYTEDIGLFKWLYIEPGSPNSWAGHWVVLDDQVKSWIIGGKTWAADLRQFVDFHPYLSNDPIVQQHLAWNESIYHTSSDRPKGAHVVVIASFKIAKCLLGRDLRLC